MSLNVVHNNDITSISNAALVVFWGPSAIKKSKLIKKLDNLSDGLITQLYDSGEFEGDLNQNVVIHKFPGMSCGRLILAGLGDEIIDGFDQYRQTVGTLSVLPSVEKSRSIGFYLDDSDVPQEMQAVVEGFNLGLFNLFE